MENPREGEIVMDVDSENLERSALRYVSKATNTTLREVYAIESGSHFVLISSPIYDFGPNSKPAGILDVVHSIEEAENGLYDYLLAQTKSLQARYYPKNTLVDKIRNHTFESPEA